MKPALTVDLARSALSGRFLVDLPMVLCGVWIIAAGQVGLSTTGGVVARGAASEWRGQSWSLEDGLSSQAKACLRAALGTQVFDALIVEASRQPDLYENVTIDFCRSDTRGPSDMPVYDLRSVFNRQLYPPNYPITVVGTGGQFWFELRQVDQFQGLGKTLRS